MSKKKYYFENEDSENCYTEAWFQDKMSEEEITELTVLEAHQSKENGYFYCKAIGEVCSKPPEGEPCGRDCSDYDPRNRKNGCCRYHGNIYEHGEEVTLKLKLNN